MTKAVRALLSRHRRPFAAVFAALAALAVAGAAGQHPHGLRVPVAARDLAAGTRLRPGDIATRAFPAGTVPDGLVPHASGRTLSGPVRRGEPLTDARLAPDDTGAGGTLAAGAIGGGPVGGGADDAGAGGGRPAPGGGSPGPDTVATPVRLADAGVARLLHPGDHVDVLAARAGPVPARVLAQGVTVVAVPRPDAGFGGAGAGGGASGDAGFGDAGEGALIVVRTSRQQAAAIARAAVDSRLTVSIVA